MNNDWDYRYFSTVLLLNWLVGLVRHSMKSIKKKSTGVHSKWFDTLHCFWRAFNHKNFSFQHNPSDCHRVDWQTFVSPPPSPPFLPKSSLLYGCGPPFPPPPTHSHRRLWPRLPLCVELLSFFHPTCHPTPLLSVGPLLSVEPVRLWYTDSFSSSSLCTLNSSIHMGRAYVVKNTRHIQLISDEPISSETWTTHSRRDAFSQSSPQKEFRCQHRRWQHPSRQDK